MLRRCRRHRQSRDVRQMYNFDVRMLPGDYKWDFLGTPKNGVFGRFWGGSGSKTGWRKVMIFGVQECFLGGNKCAKNEKDPLFPERATESCVFGSEK